MVPRILAPTAAVSGPTVAQSRFSLLPTIPTRGDAIPIACTLNWSAVTIHSAGWLAAVHHDGSPRYVSNLHPRLGERVRIRLRTGAGAPIRRALLRTSPDGEE